MVPGQTSCAEHAPRHTAQSHTKHKTPQVTLALDEPSTRSTPSAYQKFHTREKNAICNMNAGQMIAGGTHLGVPRDQSRTRSLSNHKTAKYACTSHTWRAYTQTCAQMKAHARSGHCCGSTCVRRQTDARFGASGHDGIEA
jgi:hypothetical protein